MSDAQAVLAWLIRARQRRLRLAAAEGAAIGLLTAAVFAFLGWPGRGVGTAILSSFIMLAVLGMIVRAAMEYRSGRQVAALVEARAPECRNLVITAAELLQQESRADRHAGAIAGPYLSSLVYRDAHRTVRDLPLARLFPARRPLTLLAGAVVVAALALLPVAATVGAAIGVSEVPLGIDGITVTVTPPAYAGQPTRTLRDPSRIQALAGSRLTVQVDSRAPGITLETLQGPQQLTADSGGFAGTLLADADGYLALEPVAGNGTPGARRLIGLSVTPDLPPQVRIGKPGTDMRLLDGDKTIDLLIDATDDIGLASLRLRYIRVSGSGERYTFTEGDVPLAVTRTDARGWKATARWRLNPLQLEPGDLVVYRAVVTDHRPGAAPTESDSYIAEVLAPGSLSGGGFDTDPEVERYALSQQMIILKTERLLAARAAMAPDSFTDRSAELAVEQRSVRAQFVFMMGGEVAAEPTEMNMLNEEAEAESEGEMLAGHEKNQGRDALTRATRAMSRAATRLTEGDATAALPLEREALTQLERAFAHSRILLRALTQQERLDLSRRLTGVLTEAARSSRPVTTPDTDPRLGTARTALAAIAALGTAPDAATAARQASTLAESVLRIDPASPALQRVSAALADASLPLGRRDATAAGPLLDRAATLLAEEIRATLLAAPVEPASTERRRLDGALRDALRQRPGSR